MCAKTQPVVFLSHGGGPSFFLDAKDSPMMKGMDKSSPAADYLSKMASLEKLQDPDAIMVVSAHWEEAEFTVMTNERTSLYFDYGGFPPETYKLEWRAPGAPKQALRVMELLESKGITCSTVDSRGLDHGVFVPLKLVYPKAHIPVFQLSLKKNLDIEEHLRLGEALASLREEGILIIGSGFATHNSREPDHTWATEFKEWIQSTVTDKGLSPTERKAKILAVRSVPSFSRAHPRIEHFLPVCIAMAASEYTHGEVAFSTMVAGTLLLDHYVFR
ncbi:hypothetical protein ScPMuIL_004610 [Solemya velum]